MYIVDCKAGRSPAHEKKLKPINEGIKKMKKILAIMLIAVIAVAGVFAVDVTGPTGVKLTYTIDELWTPVIKLTAAAYNDTTGGIQVGTTGEFTSGATNTFAAGSNSDGFAAGRVDFQILDLTKVNSTSAHSVTISYTCTNWLDSSNADKNTITKLNNGKITATVGASGSEAIKTTQSNVNTNDLEIAYAANKIIDRTTSKPEVGTFSVSWAASSQLAAGEYHADVVLALTAN